MTKKSSSSLWQEAVHFPLGSRGLLEEETASCKSEKSEVSANPAAFSREADAESHRALRAKSISSEIGHWLERERVIAWNSYEPVGNFSCV